MYVCILMLNLYNIIWVIYACTLMLCRWFCHVDDDMYVNLERLVDVLARLKRDKPVYFGRSGSYPGKPRRVMKG